ncbi:MAG: NADH-quinone oxidoreductase subunit NuoG [Nitrospinales bacterium]
MSDELVTLTINGKTATVPKGTVVVDAAKTVGIEIPVFCYHEKLGPFGCCRMCLVEVEKMPKMMTACTLTVSPDMVVKTESEKAAKAQKGVLEFTLLNHPLDCPVCDKGGECPLQDNTFKFGPDTTRIEYDRANQDKATPLSPVITIDRERCIACQRCTRYSDIIEKEQALVMLNRGFQNEVATFNDTPYDTRFSGNVIDICPVGALTNTVFRFQARSWDLDNAKTLCGHCGCNCNMTIGSRLNEIKRVVTRPNDAVDDGWICDKARFGYEFTKSDNRILSASKKGSSDSLTISEASVQVADSLKKIVDEHGPDSVGFIGSQQALNEELYLYQKLFRSTLGSKNIDHKTYEDTPGLPVSHFDFLDVETADLVLLIASDPSEELPILDLRIKKAVSQRGAKLITLNDQKTEMDRFADLSLRYNIGTGQAVVSAVADMLSSESSQQKGNLKEISDIADDQIKALVEKINSSKKICVIYNPAAINSLPVKNLLSVIGKIPDINCGAIPAASGTNAVGAMDMGALPDFGPGGEKVEAGLSALEMIKKAASGEIKALIIHRSNPIVDFPESSLVKKALENLELLVVHEMMNTETSKLAHFVIPSNGQGFDEGTTTNIGGRVQLRTPGMRTQNPADWKVITMMANALGDETTYTNVAAVLKEIAQKVPGYSDIGLGAIRKIGKNREAVSGNGSTTDQETELPDNSSGTYSLRISDYLFRENAMLDTTSPLSHHLKPSTVYLHGSDAEKLKVGRGEKINIVSGDEKVSATVEVTNKCNPGGIVLANTSDKGGIMALVSADNSVNKVTIEKI